MPTHGLRLVTIIAERVLEEQLIEEITQLGARNYTLTEVRREGSRGPHEWEGRDAKIETVVSPAVAERIVEHVAAHYFEFYAVILYVQAVEVVRGEKFT